MKLPCGLKRKKDPPKKIKKRHQPMKLPCGLQKEKDNKKEKDTNIIMKLPSTI